MIRIESTPRGLLGDADIVALALTADGIDGAELVAGLGVDPGAVIAARDAKGSAGEVVEVPVGRDGVRLVLLVGVGDRSQAALRKAGAALARRSATGRAAVTTAVEGADAEAVRAFAEGALLGSYAFTRRSEAKPATLGVIRLAGADPAPLAAATATATGVHLARDLALTPSSEKSPEWLAARAVEVAQAAGLDVTVWDEQRLEAEGFGGILGVGRGSARPPRLVHLVHAPRGARRHIVLVGKGITFDTGGLSLKRPWDVMKAMKTDMGGAAAVLGTMRAVRDLDVPHRVTALLPLAENMLGAAATRPGDVVRHWGGRTVEVLNTDAEGRLVLADALAYAVARLAPDAVIDLATLTGAATLGLGRRDAPLYSTAPDLADALVAAGAAGGERLWPMPLVDDYRPALDSAVADLRNIADPELGFQAGSIIAALFLREFVGTVPWAHLDIAGTGRADADEDEVSKGATGFGVRTLLRYLTA